MNFETLRPLFWLAFRLRCLSERMLKQTCCQSQNFRKVATSNSHFIRVLGLVFFYTPSRLFGLGLGFRV